MPLFFQLYRTLNLNCCRSEFVESCKVCNLAGSKSRSSRAMVRRFSGLSCCASLLSSLVVKSSDVFEIEIYYRHLKYSILVGIPALSTYLIVLSIIMKIRNVCHVSDTLTAASTFILNCGNRWSAKNFKIPCKERTMTHVIDV